MNGMSLTEVDSNFAPCEWKQLSKYIRGIFANAQSQDTVRLEIQKFVQQYDEYMMTVGQRKCRQVGFEVIMRPMV